MIKDLSEDLLLKASLIYQEIQYEAYNSMVKEPFVYPSQRILQRKRIMGDPTSEERRVILFIFQEEGAINILQKCDNYRYEPEKWLIEVINPRFNELESQIKQAINPSGVQVGAWIIPSDDKNPTIAITPPDKRDCWYEEKQLRFKLSNGGIDQLDFSKAEKSQKVFETFWDLWNGNSTGEYSLIDVRAKYKQKFKTEAPGIGKIVSNIRPSIINPKTMIRDRIKWVYNPKNKKWIFKIFPLQR